MLILIFVHPSKVKVIPIGSSIRVISITLSASSMAFFKIFPSSKQRSGNFKKEFKKSNSCLALGLLIQDNAHPYETVRQSNNV